MGFNAKSCDVEMSQVTQTARKKTQEIMTFKIRCESTILNGKIHMKKKCSFY